jgi:hypothetical protein
VLCSYLSRAELIRAARANPLLAQFYALVEVTIGHRFRLNQSMVDVLAEAGIPMLPAHTPREPADTALGYARTEITSVAGRR